mmetsp:Transcript_11944/g.17807  ORF Transcript_11944/g.17807 Transcript_11944/m.17807 type:complete len:87 (-) Transcript_11944:145-405(-)
MKSTALLALETHMITKVEKARAELAVKTEELREEKSKTKRLEDEMRVMQSQFEEMKKEKEGEVSRLKTFLKLYKSRIELERRSFEK